VCLGGFVILRAAAPPTGQSDPYYSGSIVNLTSRPCKDRGVSCGWIRSCIAGPATEKPGAKVTNERLRAMGWFSSLAGLASFPLERKPRLSL